MIYINIYCIYICFSVLSYSDLFLYTFFKYILLLFNFLNFHVVILLFVGVLLFVSFGCCSLLKLCFHLCLKCFFERDVLCSCLHCVSTLILFIKIT